MTLFATRSNGNVTEHNVTNLNILTPNDTIELQASGLELDFIRRHFTNIPITDSTIVRWHGEYAKFIANNLNFFSS